MLSTSILSVISGRLADSSQRQPYSTGPGHPAAQGALHRIVFGARAEVVGRYVETLAVEEANLPMASSTGYRSPHMLSGYLPTLSNNVYTGLRTLH
ncbi:hypothetical protein [Streptomyces lavendulae]|uniref:hypothetical protein n=1 Tax=Streptomyces lavendulae TaxID=1914 RepID=UPI00381E71D7